MMQHTDWLRRFHLEAAGVRGVLVRLSGVWQEIRGHAAYPVPLATLLGETLAASALFAGDLKMAGTLSIHLRGNGPLKLLFAECADDGAMRGLARWDEDAGEEHFARPEPGAILAITLEQAERNQRYQGLVPIEGGDLASAFEGYFARSEQLPTALRLVATPGACAGMLVQQIARPGGPERSDDYQRIATLFGTVRDEELLSLAPEVLLRRLFAEDDIRLHDALRLRFECRCSRARVAEVLRSLGPAAEGEGEGPVEVRCEFCNRVYRFDAVDLAAAYQGDVAAPGPRTAQ
jgi:molecular chaperone Hsp33